MLTEEVRKGGSALDLLLRKAKSRLKALDVELTETEEAKSAPVMLRRRPWYRRGKRWSRPRPRTRPWH
jgi:hypothetical protein